jgi:hypothetical protein
LGEEAALRAVVGRVSSFVVVVVVVAKPRVHGMVLVAHPWFPNENLPRVPPTAGRLLLLVLMRGMDDNKNENAPTFCPTASNKETVQRSTPVSLQPFIFPDVKPLDYKLK